MTEGCAQRLQPRLLARTLASMITSDACFAASLLRRVKLSDLDRNHPLTEVPDTRVNAARDVAPTGDTPAPFRS